MDKIFVMIPSLFDYDILETVNDCVSKARYPERITFGMSIQGLDKIDFSHIPNERRIIYLENNTVYGIGKTRYFIQQLHNDEEYILSIDCHTGFIEDWDEKLIAEHKLIKNDKAIISQFLLDHYSDKYCESIHRYAYQDPLAIDYAGNDLNKVIDKRRLVQRISSHFIFATNEFAKIPYSSRYIWGIQDNLFSLKLYCHGFDTYELQNTYLKTKAKDPAGNKERTTWLYRAYGDSLKEDLQDYSIFTGESSQIEYNYENVYPSYHLIDKQSRYISNFDKGASDLLLQGYSDILEEDMRGLERSIKDYYNFHGITEDEVIKSATRLDYKDEGII